MTAWFDCRLQAVTFVLLVVVAKEKEVFSESIVVIRFANGDEFTNQDNCNSNWCTEHGGFCSSSCCRCKCKFGETFMIGKTRCVRDTSFLLSSEEGCKFQFKSCDKSTILRTIDLRSSGEEKMEMCEKVVKSTHLFDCKVFGNATRYYFNGKWQYLPPGTGIEKTFSLKVGSKSKITLKWKATTMLKGLLLSTKAKCQISRSKRNSLTVGSCLLFKTAGAYNYVIPKPTATTSHDNRTGLSSSSKSAVVMCSLLAVGILCAVMLFYFRRRRKRNETGQQNIDNAGNPSYERGEDTSIHFSPNSTTKDRHSTEVNTNDENNYQPLINTSKPSAPPGKPHVYKSLERDKDKPSDLMNKPLQPAAASQPEYASLENFGPSKKKPKHTYQPLGTPKKAEDEEELPEYQEIPEYQVIEKSKPRTKDNCLTQEPCLSKTSSTEKPVKERKESEDEDNYVGEKPRSPECCQGSGDDQPIYRELEEPGPPEKLMAESEHEYLDLLP